MSVFNINRIFDNEFGNEYKVEIISIIPVISDSQISEITTNAISKGHGMKRFLHKEGASCYECMIIYKLKDRKPITGCSFTSMGSNIGLSSIGFGIPNTTQPTSMGSNIGLSSIGFGIPNTTQPTSMGSNIGLSSIGFNPFTTKQPISMEHVTTKQPTNMEDPITTKQSGFMVADTCFGQKQPTAIKTEPNKDEDVNKVEMNNIKPGSYVWYNKKNAVAKVLEYDMDSNSYTIEYEGRIIDTTDKFIDKICIKKNGNCI